VSSLRFVARQELIFGHARARRHRRPRQGDPRRQRHARPPRGAPRPERELAVLACAGDRPAVRAHADLPPVPARRDPARVGELGRLRARGRVHGRERRHGGPDLPLVRRAPRTRAGDRRDPRLRQPDPASSTRSASRA
jgi:hypothetical protein